VSQIESSHSLSLPLSLALSLSVETEKGTRRDSARRSLRVTGITSAPRLRQRDDFDTLPASPPPQPLSENKINLDLSVNELISPDEIRNFLVTRDTLALRPFVHSVHTPEITAAFIPVYDRSINFTSVLRTGADSSSRLPSSRRPIEIGALPSSRSHDPVSPLLSEKYLPSWSRRGLASYNVVR